MNISLTPELEKLVNHKVKSGMYQTASEVVREGLRLLRERDQRLESLQRDVHLGLEAIEHGEFEDFSSGEIEDLARQVKERGRKRLKEKARKSGVR